jgi:hypothetical protein
VENLKKAFEAVGVGASANPAACNNAIPAVPDFNIIYSDWPAGLSNATALPGPGLTLITEGPAYLIGEVNTYDSAPSEPGQQGYQPAAVITPNMVNLLSDRFDFPDHVPELARHPDNGLVSNSSVGYQAEIDWYLAQNSEMSNAVKAVGEDPSMPLRYNVSIVGNLAADLTYMGFARQERWAYPQNPGSDAPWQYATVPVEVTGTLLRLPRDNFIPAYQYGDDWFETRACASCNCVGLGCGVPPPAPHSALAWPSCRGCSPECTPSPPNIGCNRPEEDTVEADSYKSMDTYFYEQGYITGNVPPGDLYALTYAGWRELAATDQNFNNHCMALQGSN